MWSIRPLPTGRSSMNSVTSPPVAGFAASAANSMRTVTSPSGSGSSACWRKTKTPIIE